jgi:uncharacterized integral membrane protein
LVTLVAQNMDFVELRFIAWDVGLPISLPVVCAYLLGAWTGGSLFAFFKRERKELRHGPRVALATKNIHARK